MVQPVSTCLSSWPFGSNVTKPVIGMLHLLPLPGSPGCDHEWERIRSTMIREAEILAENGVHALMLENFGDTPFYPGRVPHYVVAHITALACEIKRYFPDTPLGVNVLRNDGQSAVAVANAAGCQFVRVNVLCGARIADQGLIEGAAHEVLRDRAMLNAKQIKIMADVNVKHSTAVGDSVIESEVDDTIERGHADAVITSGSGTGRATEVEELAAVAAVVRGRVPVFVGSGVSIETIDAYLPHADGFIVGTAFKRDGIPTNPVDADRVRMFMDQVSYL